MNEIKELVEEYLRWMKDRTVIRELNDGHGWVEITTPHLDQHNDYIQIYARKKGTAFELSDGGQTLMDLEHSGLSFSHSKKRQEILQTILNGFGVTEEHGELKASATPANFPVKKHGLVQAIAAVGDMAMLTSANVETLFVEDVAKWLFENDIRYTPRVRFAGTAFEHTFDFVIPKSRHAPERILQAITYPSKNAAKLLIMGWQDTWKSRPDNSEAFALLNDQVTKPSNEVVSAFTSYKIQPVLWSQREHALSQLLH